LRAGAYGFLPKECAADDLAKALKLVIGGRRYISPALAQAMAEDTSFERDSSRPLHTLLSGREFEVFRKIAAGARPTDIGAEMALSVKTVSTYRARIMDKMSFRCNADLTSYALRNNLIE
jgi:two-component system invasion response regulator UvrY